MSQEYHKMHKKSWTCDECICISVRTGTHNSRVIVRHSSILHIILNLLALCLCHKGIETLICTGDLGPHWSLGAVGRLMYKPLCCSAVMCTLFELDQPDLSPAAPSSGLLSQSWCSWRWKCVCRRPGPPSISHLGGGGQAAYTGTVSIRLQVPGDWDLPRIVWACPGCKFRSYWEAVTQWREKKMIW